MLKNDEMSDPTSCLNTAAPDELVFVLLGRDEAAPAAIRAWCADRILRGKNAVHDPQIKAAYQCAYDMERARREATLVANVPDAVAKHQHAKSK